MQRDKETRGPKELLDLLSKLGNNIKKDFEAKLHNLDELDKEIKSWMSVVVETIHTICSHMDSDVLLESNETGS